LLYHGNKGNAGENGEKQSNSTDMMEIYFCRQEPMIFNEN
jgi:hypothetical protein